MNELRAIVNRHDLYAFGKSRGYIGDLLFHPLNHCQGVLAAPQDDDPGHNFALAIQIGNAASQFRTFDDLAHVLNTDRSSFGTSLKDDIAKLFERSA